MFLSCAPRLFLTGTPCCCHRRITPPSRNMSILLSPRPFACARLLASVRPRNGGMKYLRSIPNLILFTRAELPRRAKPAVVFVSFADELPAIAALWIRTRNFSREKITIYISIFSHFNWTIPTCVLYDLSRYCFDALLVMPRVTKKNEKKAAAVAKKID